VTRSKCVTVSGAFASYINKTCRSSSHIPARLLKREKKEKEKREEGKEREGREEKRKEKRDEIECGRLLDFAIEGILFI
jgi:hypothetical protein